MEFIQINAQSDVPKYRQIIHSVHAAIRRGELKRGDKMPSLNAIKNTFGLSRDTVLSAFKEMQAGKLITSSPGKGYYIASTNVEQEEKIFLLFDELNSFKEDLYTAFLEEAGKKAKVDIYFHHFNLHVFKTLIEENKDAYTSFVIMPGSLTHITGAIKKLPPKKTFLLDRTANGLNHLGAVYQNFEKDAMQAMEEGISLLQKYQRLVLVYPKGNEPPERLDGFKKFCELHGFPHVIIPSLTRWSWQKGDVYFVPNDRHLVQVIKQTEQHGLRIGTDLGIVSFNDTMLKEVVAGGITTISTDFAQMGHLMAQMVMSGEKKRIENPAQLIIRKSL